VEAVGTGRTGDRWVRQTNVDEVVDANVTRDGWEGWVEHLVGK